MRKWLSRAKDSITRAYPTVVIPAIGLGILVSITIMWLVGRITFGEQSVVVIAALGVALALFPFLAEVSLPGGGGFKLRTELKEVQDVQLTGEVVFNKDEEPRQLYWIDSEGKKRFLPNTDTASLFATQKGYIGVGKERFAKIESGRDIQPLSQKSFKRKENHVFAVHDEGIFYLPSWSLPIKYELSKLEDLAEMNDEDFRKEIRR